MTFPGEKYRTIPELWNGKSMFRIIALRDFDLHSSFGGVLAGERGGLISSSDNLSHNGSCWVGENARVSGKARISGDALVSEYAVVSGNSTVSNNSKVSRHAQVTGAVNLSGSSTVSGHAHISGYVSVQNASVSANARIKGPRYLDGVDRRIRIPPGAFLADSVLIENSRDVLVLGPIGSRRDSLTASRSTKGLRLFTGCFDGTVEEFLTALHDNHGFDSQHGQDYLRALTYIEDHFHDEAPSE